MNEKQKDYKEFFIWFYNTFLEPIEEDSVEESSHKFLKIFDNIDCLRLSIHYNAEATAINFFEICSIKDNSIDSFSFFIRPSTTIQKTTITITNKEMVDEYGKTMRNIPGSPYVDKDPDTSIGGYPKIVKQILYLGEKELKVIEVHQCPRFDDIVYIKELIKAQKTQEDSIEIANIKLFAYIPPFASLAGGGASQDKIKELLERIKNVKEELEDRDNLVKELESNADQKQTQIAILEQQISSLAQDIEQRNKTIEEKENKIAESATAISERNKTISSLKRQLQQEKEKKHSHEKIPELQIGEETFVEINDQDKVPDYSKKQLKKFLSNKNFSAEDAKDLAHNPNILSAYGELYSDGKMEECKHIEAALKNSDIGTLEKHALEIANDVPEIPAYNIMPEFLPSAAPGMSGLAYYEIDLTNIALGFFCLQQRDFRNPLFIVSSKIFFQNICSQLDVKHSSWDILMQMREKFLTSPQFPEITCTIGILNFKTHEFNYVRAGAPYIYLQNKGENQGSFKKCLGVPKISSYSPEVNYRKLESNIKIKERCMITLGNRNFWKIKQSFEGENIEKLLVEIREDLSKRDEEKDIHDKDIYLLGLERTQNA